jgi:hypothetical protein
MSHHEDYNEPMLHTGSLNNDDELAHKDPNHGNYEEIGHPIAHEDANAVHVEHANIV